MTAPGLSSGPTPLNVIRQWLNNRAGARVVLATGCFDLLHAGHLYFLQQAHRLGDLLIVGVNSDQSVRELKGPDRPIIGEHERAALVAALRWVDRVFLYDEPAADTQIRILRPNVFVIGRESLTAYPSELTAAEAVSAHVHVTDRIHSYSTTSIVDTLRAHQ
ncbi:adenylyltransferase/cytidyltransferase family protein [Actinoplanes flavus]|uniref:Adenylyltransferase/cytidyltransferase family protein n=1 Tax=Actinoplanes flavus TaxID=2820290 RepID=A0ABS3UCX6_9ACTN|nr:adenylyltransferase/cytidyltransferase family protein [Actinoplanes flavus]MBO3736633.1 adenylyltransferase/cytidyltransferase family protein [Actinoplanes flavus]